MKNQGSLGLPQDGISCYSILKKKCWVVRTFLTPLPYHVLPLARGVLQLNHMHNNNRQDNVSSFIWYAYKLAIKQYKAMEDNDDQIEFNVMEEMRK